jgi:hypothetical protein
MRKRKVQTPKPLVAAFLESLTVQYQLGRASLSKNDLELAPGNLFVAR